MLLTERSASAASSSPRWAGKLLLHNVSVAGAGKMRFRQFGSDEVLVDRRATTGRMLSLLVVFPRINMSTGSRTAAYRDFDDRGFKGVVAINGSNGMGRQRNTYVVASVARLSGARIIVQVGNP